MANQHKEHSNPFSKWLPFDINSSMSHMLPEFMQQMPLLIEEANRQCYYERKDKSCKYSLLNEPQQSNVDGNWMFASNKQCEVIRLNYSFRNYLINEYPDGGKNLGYERSYGITNNIIQDYKDTVEIIQGGPR